VYNSSNTNADSNIYINSYQYPEGKSGEEGGKFFLGDTNKFNSAEIEVFKVIYSENINIKINHFQKIKVLKIKLK